MKKPKQSELIPVPPPFDSPDFAAAWSDWESFRKEIRKPVTPTVRRIQFARLKGMGKALAIESINQSINSGWRGLFEPKGGGNGSESNGDAPQAGPSPPCADWKARAERLRGRELRLSWHTHAKTDVNLLADLLADMEERP